MSTNGSRDGVGLLRIAGSISLVILSCITLSILYNVEDASSNVQLESASDLDWGAFNQQLSHDWCSSCLIRFYFQSEKLNLMTYDSD
jgi:hypothetical protein